MAESISVSLTGGYSWRANKSFGVLMEMIANMTRLGWRSIHEGVSKRFRLDTASRAQDGNPWDTKEKTEDDKFRERAKDIGNLRRGNKGLDMELLISSVLTHLDHPADVRCNCFVYKGMPNKAAGGGEPDIVFRPQEPVDFQVVCEVSANKGLTDSEYRQQLDSALRHAVYEHNEAGVSVTYALLLNLREASTDKRIHKIYHEFVKANKKTNEKTLGLLRRSWPSAGCLSIAGCWRNPGSLDQDQAVLVMQEKYEVCCGLFHGFDRTAWISGTPAERLGLLPAAQEHILAQEKGKERCLHAVRELSQAFALAVPHEEARAIRDEVAFFQAVRSALAKRSAFEGKTEEELDHAIRQLVSRAVASEGVLDIFATAGLDKPDISIQSDEFLAEVQGMPQRNLAVELLQKLMKGELAVRRRKNVVQARSLAEMLEQTILRY